MEIDSKKVYELRKITSCGVMECKNALKESIGDIGKAIEILKIRGAAKSDSKISKNRKTEEGVVLIKISEDKQIGAIIEINCETDFVSRSNDFIMFVKEIANFVVNNRIKSIEELELADISGNSFDKLKKELISKVDENIILKRLSVFVAGDNEKIFGYSHNNKICSMIILKGEKIDNSETIGKDISIHIVASNPMAINKNCVSNEYIEEQKNIFYEQTKGTNKPKQIVDMIVDGKIKKIFDEICLINQNFVKNPELKISDILNKSNLDIVKFIRYELGESI